MNKGLMKIYIKPGVMLCFVILLAGCGVEDKGNGLQEDPRNELRQQSAEDPPVDKPQIATASAPAPQAIFPEKHLNFIDMYCIDCHDAASKKGEVNLEDLPLHIETIEQAETWQKVLSALNAGEMPPKKKKQPETSGEGGFPG